MMNFKRNVRASVLVVPGAALLLSACGGGSSAYGPATTAPSTGTQAAAQQSSLAGSTAGTTGSSAAANSAAAVKPAPKAYVGLFKDNAVGVIDTATQRQMTTIPVPAGPHGLVITPDGRKVYVSSDGDSTVSVIATANDQVVASLPVNAPHNSAITPDGHFAYVGSQQKDATGIVVLDLGTKTQVSSVPVGNQPRALNFSSDGKQLYFTLVGSDAVQVLDPATNRLLPEIAVGAAPHHPIFTPDSKLALVVAQGPGDMDLIDPMKGTQTGKVQVGTFPHWIGLSSDGKMAYVSNEGSNDVSVVDLGMRMVVGTVSTGNAPRKIALQPGAVGSSPVAAAGASSGNGATTAPASGRTAKLGSVSYADHGTKDAAGQTTIDMEADDFSFSPTFVRAAPGQKLTLNIRNTSGTLHNFSIAGQIDKDIPPHGAITMDVTVPQSGVLPFTCKYHTALGMNGQLLSGSAAPQTV